MLYGHYIFGTSGKDGISFHCHHLANDHVAALKMRVNKVWHTLQPLPTPNRASLKSRTLEIWVTNGIKSKILVGFYWSGNTLLFIHLQLFFHRIGKSTWLSSVPFTIHTCLKIFQLALQRLPVFVPILSIYTRSYNQCLQVCRPVRFVMQFASSKSYGKSHPIANNGTFQTFATKGSCTTFLRLNCNLNWRLSDEVASHNEMGGPNRTDLCLWNHAENCTH